MAPKLGLKRLAAAIAECAHCLSKTRYLQRKIKHKDNAFETETETKKRSSQASPHQQNHHNARNHDLPGYIAQTHNREPNDRDAIKYSPAA